MDFITDQSGRYLVQLSRLLDVPDFVKSAAVDLDEVAGLQPHEFADSVNREFPIVDPGQVYLGLAYVKLAGIENPQLVTRLKRAAALHKIEGEIAKLDEVLGAQTKQANTHDFAVTIDFEGAPDHMKVAGIKNFYPIHTPEAIENSARQICADQSRIPMGLFIAGCQALVKAARTHAVPPRLIPSTVWEFGDDYFVDYDHVSFQAAKRASVTGDEIYREIAKSASEDLNTPIGDWIDAWREADHQHGIEGKPGVKDAYLVFYSGVDKQAFDQRMADWLVVGGAAVPKSALAAVPLDALRKNFPSAVAGDLTTLVKHATNDTGMKLQEVCQSLSEPVQKVLLSLVLRHA